MKDLHWLFHKLHVRELCQSSPTVDRPCAPMITLPDNPSATVSCATVTFPDGPSSGAIQKTATSGTSRPVSTVHVEKSMPIDEMAGLTEPSSTPTVSHESNSASALTATSAGL